MKKNFKFMLVALFALFGFNGAMAAELVNSTQYDTDGFQYVIKSMKKSGSTWTGEVSVKKNDLKSATLTIKDEVSITVEGTVGGESVVGPVTFAVVEIEDNAFEGLTDITTITIGNKIKKIGDEAFKGCNKVTTLTFKENTNDIEIGDDAFNGFQITTLDLRPLKGLVESVGKWFNNTPFVEGTDDVKNAKLTTIYFPANMKAVVEDAFAGFSKLANVTFAAPTLTGTGKYFNTNHLTIGTGAFKETAIVNLDLENAFIEDLNPLFEYNNVTLKTVRMAKSVKTLKAMALADCIQLNTVTFDGCSNLQELEGGSLSNTVVSSYDFSQCYTPTKNAAGAVIGYAKFLNFTDANPFVNGITETNKNLETVTLPKDAALTWSPVNYIGTTFANCEVLTAINNLEISKIKKVEDGAFANDIALTALSFPGSLETVTDAPFAGCKKLATLTFDGTALTQIGTTPVAPEYYTEETANAYNATLDGAKAADDVKTPAVYTVVGEGSDLTAGDTYYTSAEGDGEFISDGSETNVAANTYWTLTTAAELYTADEAAAYNALLDGAVADGDLKNTPVDAQDLFGDYTYDGVEFASPLTTLSITLPAATPKKSTSVAINSAAFSGNGAEKSALTTVNIATGGVFAGTIAENAIQMSAKANDAVTFGDIVAGATLNSIAGPQGTNTATLTIGSYAGATLTTAPIVTGTITEAIVNGAVSGENVLTAIGQAQTIKFNDDIKGAIVAPAAPNAVLTAVEFNGLLGDGATPNIIPAAAFDEINAPLLTNVKFQPATDDVPTAKVFNIKAFGTSEKGAAAKITLLTVTGIKVLYDNKEKNLYNIKLFDAQDPPVVLETLLAYGNSEDCQYFYGKMKFDTKVAIAKVNGADENQVEVYSAFVDKADQKIYMDRLSLKNGKYVVAENQPVIVRVKQPAHPEAYEAVDGAYKVAVEYETTNTYSTMRYARYGKTSYSILNDLQWTEKVFSSDYIGTYYVGKTLYAMANPAKIGTLQFDKVLKTSYLPKNALFVETDTPEEASAAQMEIVWLDGEGDVTGIIEQLYENDNDNAIYNLQGVRVNNAQKGVYIKNGKKFIVK